MKRCALYRTLGPFTLFLALACQSSAGDDTATGTETNWLQTCEADSECGELSCECGVCTQTCTRTADCSPEGAVCAPSGERAVVELCGGGSAVAGLCLPAASETSDGGAFSTDRTDTVDDSSAAVTEPTTQADAAVAPTSTDAATRPGQSDVADAASDEPATSSEASTDAASVSPAVSTDAASIDAGASAPDIDAAQPPLCTADRTELLSGCCYDDTDCTSQERCYQADCSSDPLTAGRCATPPTNGACLDARDCAAGERCEGGQLALCGTLGPDSLGTCVADCEEDRCHPERCDEPGETCCDPLPADGPNYCGPGLSCVGNVCEEQAETTTPEEQARLLCEQTGGAWDAQSCGDYQCGSPPDCTAIVPGCNCGPASTFSDLGCMEDPACNAP